MSRSLRSSRSARRLAQRSSRPRTNDDAPALNSAGSTTSSPPRTKGRNDPMPITPEEQAVARMFGMTDAAYVLHRDNPHVDAADIERHAELERKARETLDLERAIEAERARQAA